MADIDIDVLGYLNDDGTHKIWAISHDTDRVCHGKVYGSSKGLRCTAANNADNRLRGGHIRLKLRDGYIRLLHLKHENYGRVDDGLLKGIVGGVSRVIEGQTRNPIAYNEIEGMVARHLVALGVDTGHILQHMASGRNGTPVAVRTVTGLFFLQSTTSKRAARQPTSRPSTLHACAVVDPAWNF
jgi:hypothetical protein